MVPYLPRKVWRIVLMIVLYYKLMKFFSLRPCHRALFWGNSYDELLEA